MSAWASSALALLLVYPLATSRVHAVNRPFFDRRPEFCRLLLEVPRHVSIHERVIVDGLVSRWTAQLLLLGHAVRAMDRVRQSRAQIVCETKGIMIGNARLVVGMPVGMIGARGRCGSRRLLLLHLEPLRLAFRLVSRSVSALAFLVAIGSQMTRTAQRRGRDGSWTGRGRGSSSSGSGLLQRTAGEAARRSHGGE